MKSASFLIVIALLGAGIFISRDSSTGPADRMEPHHVTTRIDTAPLCPWRDPAADQKTFFPTATSHLLETRILSGRRMELATRLGRPPTAEENALQLQHIYKEGEVLGTILTRRAKGLHGAIELVIAMQPDGRLRGVRIQRSREPATALATLEKTWLGLFSGQTMASLPKPITEESDGETEKTEVAILEGVRASLILFEVAQKEEAQ